MMTENDIKSMGLVLSINECIEIAKGVIESAKDKLKYARSCTSKKNHKKNDGVLRSDMLSPGTIEKDGV